MPASSWQPQDSSSMARITDEGVGMRIPDRRESVLERPLALTMRRRKTSRMAFWAGSMLSTPNLGMTFSHR